MMRYAVTLLLPFLLAAAPATFEVTHYGATGDGKTLDSPPINKAIEAAAAAGGGIVHFSPGTYLSFSIHLQSNVTLKFDKGTTLIAAKPGSAGGYDPAELNAVAGKFEDVGHKHWHDALMWGDGLQNIQILGPVLIDNHNITRSDPKTGVADKSIGLKNCKHVIIRDVVMDHGGHFGILATGVDDLLIDDFTIDADRDGMDIDACHDVTITNCKVNSPFDDGICLKSTYALGVKRACENVTVSNCVVSGFDLGSYLTGTLTRKIHHYDDNTPTGRIKLGTESTGGFKNITVTNDYYVYCRGIAIETVDGGDIDNVTFSHIRMRDIENSPIFIRLGARLNEPDEKTIGQLNHVRIDDVICENADTRFGCIIAGEPGHNIQDVQISNVHITGRGGGTAAQAKIVPPEEEGRKGKVDHYPEPLRWGVMPEWAAFIRHVDGLQFHDVTFTLKTPDQRAPFILNDASNILFDGVTVPQPPAGVPSMVLTKVNNFTSTNCQGLPNIVRQSVDQEQVK